MKSLLPHALFLAILLPVSGAFAQTAPAPAPSAAAPSPALDFGDFKSSTLTGKAWKALEAKSYAEVAAYTGKCIDSFKTQALAQQKALTAPPTEKADVFAQWALNDVGTCYFILGKSLEEQDKKKEALDAYKFLADNLPFAQCWDPKGWFWKPGEAAKERISALDFDSLK